MAPREPKVKSDTIKRMAKALRDVCNAVQENLSILPPTHPNRVRHAELLDRTKRTLEEYKKQAGDRCFG